MDEQAVRQKTSSQVKLIRQSVDDIDTPALVIDLDAMERNLQTMQRFADQHHVKLRPHAKMHKSAALALQQMAAGAVGVCVQKVSEARAMLAGGVRDIYISNEVVLLSKLELLVDAFIGLAAQNGKLSIAVDSLQGIRNLAQALQNVDAQGSARIHVFIEIDVGQARCGVPPGDAALPLAREIALHPRLHFAGLQAYHGRAQHQRTVVERCATLAQVMQDVQRTRAALEREGFTVALVTGAGSGTFGIEAASGVFGELQAGSYLFMDADYAQNETDPAQPTFEHALFVKSHVMSVQPGRAVCDAGHKSHAIDSGLPRVHGRGDDLRYTSCSDEHGVLHGSTLPQLGEVVWLIPGHCDPTVNLHDHMIGVRGGLQHGVVERIIAVDARGALT
jgi:D-serine deaminase-like pyridoxal phosphate-dependent protein